MTDPASRTPIATSTDQLSPGADHYITAKAAYLQRLRRIEGQARGLQHMVEQEKHCIDILTQVSAMTKALQSFALALLADHLRHCVLDAAGEAEPAAKVEEATAAVTRLVRS